MRRVLLLTLGLVVGLSVCEGQRGGTIKRAAPPVKNISSGEAAEFLELFRNQRLASDYSLKFNLVQMPRRGQQIVYAGTMWGTWGSRGPMTRMQLYSLVKPIEKLDLLIHGGLDPKIWVLGEDGNARQLTQKESFEPIMGSLLYSPYELFMNFIYWKDFQYEGSQRIRSRPAHFFLMEPPVDVKEELPNLRGVRMAIDSGYKAPIRAEVLNESGQVERVFQVLNFKKVKEEWLIKDIDLIDNESRDKARFEIGGAAVGLRLDEQYFKPENMRVGVPLVENSEYRLM